MSQVRVTKQFKEDFDLWADHVIRTGAWTSEDVEGLKKLMREYELADGKDRLRDHLIAIDDPKDRYNLWAAFFADEAASIRGGAGINERIRNQIAAEKMKEAA
jgi:hypothetical protein